MVAEHNQMHGFWSSPVSAAMVAEQGKRIRELSCVEHADAGFSLAWVEARPELQGRCIIMRRNAAGEVQELLNEEGLSARSLVNSYGGGALLLTPDAVFFVNHEPSTSNQDQRIFRLPIDHRQNVCGPAEPITKIDACSYGNLSFDPRYQRVVCVREQYLAEGESEQAVVAIHLSESRQGQVDILAEGYDFFSAPELDPDSCQLACVAWNQPNMPWDNTELLLVTLNEQGHADSRRVINESFKEPANRGESIQQPRWDRRGRLHFVSDRDNWWKIYRYDPLNNEIYRCFPEDSVALERAEFGLPPWELGVSTFGFSATNTLFGLCVIDGRWQLASLEDVPSADLKNGKSDMQLQRLRLNNTEADVLSHLHVGDSELALIAAGVGESARVALVRETQLIEVADTPGSQLSDTKIDVSEPLSIRFPTGDSGQESFAFFYPPTAAPLDHVGISANGLPPLIIKTHGGPTSASYPQLDWSIQFFTSRGFAVADVNYRGSTGYGRDYRHALYGEWGVYDLADCVACIDYLSAQGQINPERVFARGQSAGGYLTLMLACYTDRLRAGASTAGISDLSLLYTHTHRFEKEYMHKLLNCTPADDERDVYRQRSPLYAKAPSTPLLFVQGSADKVVPPDQTDAILCRLKDEGVDAELLLFEGEQHGLRRSENIEQALLAELTFFQRYL